MAEESEQNRKQYGETPIPKTTVEMKILSAAGETKGETPVSEAPPDQGREVSETSRTLREYRGATPIPKTMVEKSGEMTRGETPIPKVEIAPEKKD